MMNQKQLDFGMILSRIDNLQIGVALVAAHASMPNNLFYLTRVGRQTAH